MEVTDVMYWTLICSKTYSRLKNKPANLLKNKNHTFQEKERHNYILALARYCNIKGVSEQDTLNGCLGYVQTDFLEEEITKIVKHVYSISITFLHWCKSAQQSLYYAGF
jgi:hypothetical protein